MGCPVGVQRHFRHHGQADSFAAPQESRPQYKCCLTGMAIGPKDIRPKPCAAPALRSIPNLIQRRQDPIFDVPACAYSRKNYGLNWIPPGNGRIGNCPASGFAAPLPACSHLWHTELLRSGSRILLGSEQLNERVANRFGQETFTGARAWAVRLWRTPCSIRRPRAGRLTDGPTFRPQFLHHRAH